MSTLDETNIPKYDWDKLRKQILADDHIKNETIMVTLPSPEEAAIRDVIYSCIIKDTSPGIYPVRDINSSNREKLKIRQSGISGHHCTGKGCVSCKKS